jgi:hypothetical protein
MMTLTNDVIICGYAKPLVERFACSLSQPLDLVFYHQFPAL